MKVWFKHLSEQSWWVILIEVVLFLGILFGCLCADAALLMVLWNYAMVAAFVTAAPIGFWQAFCLGLVPLFLCSRITWSRNND